jgi:hypothetical protein
MPEQKKKPTPTWEVVESGPVCVDGLCGLEGEPLPPADESMQKHETTEEKQQP